MKKLVIAVVAAIVVLSGVAVQSAFAQHGGDETTPPTTTTTTVVLGSNLIPVPVVSTWKLKSLTPTTAELTVKLIDGTKFYSGSDTDVQDVNVDQFGAVTFLSTINQLPIMQWVDHLNAYYAVVAQGGKTGIPTGVCADHLFVIGATGPVTNPLCINQ